jgi:hypothetical protein
MIRIAQASSSETFKKYGKAPNQRRTGASRTKPEGNLDGELNVVPWYGGWEAVYRAIDGEVAERIATIAYRAVANGNYIGYSWSGNTQLFDAMKKKGTTDPMDVDTLVNCDCGTKVGVCVYFAGIHDEGLRAMTTWREDEILMRTNAFVKLTDKEMLDKGKGIRRGDIVLKSGHTAVVLDSDPVEPSGAMFVFQKFSFNGVAISAGTSGTRAVQRTKMVGKKGYKIINVRLSYVSNSALSNVVPFLGWGDDDQLAVNFYWASGAKGTMDATVTVVYVRDELTQS